MCVKLIHTFWCINVLNMLQVMSLDFIVFFRNFHALLTIIHVWSSVSSPKFHRLFVWSLYTFWYVNIPSVTAGYIRFSDLIVFFFGNFRWSCYGLLASHGLRQSSFYVFFQKKAINPPNITPNKLQFIQLLQCAFKIFEVKWNMKLKEIKTRFVWHLNVRWWFWIH